MRPAERKTILVVEDEDHVRNFVRMYLEAEGYRVLEAGNGKEALDRLGAVKVDLVVTDIVMPAMGGVDFYMALKDRPGLRDLPVIVISVRDDTQEIQYATLLGVDEYLTKPFDPNELVRRIRALLGEG